jgi:hypothetical protein
MSKLENTATDAREAWLEENEKVEDTNPSEKEIKAADRQKTLESIGFYDATSFQGKHALGYASAVMKAREDANKEIQQKYYAGDQVAFNRFMASRAAKDTNELFNAEAHERTQLLRYRQEEDRAELINSRTALSNQISGSIGAVADKSMQAIAISTNMVNSARAAVQSAQSNLDDAIKRAKNAEESGDEVDPHEVEAFQWDLDEKNKTLIDALGAQEAAGLAQDKALNDEFSASHARIASATKAHFEKRYDEFLQYGYGENMAYAMASEEAAELAKGVIEDLIANGNREAASAILDMMDLEKPKKNEETGKYEIDRSNRGYMGAGSIYKFKDAIKAQRRQEAAEAKAAAKVANDALKVEANNIKMAATMGAIDDMKTAYAVVSELGKKGYVETSEVLDHCKSAIESRVKTREAAAKVIKKAAEDKNKELTGDYEQTVKNTISNLIYSTEREVIVSSTKGGAVTKATVDKITYTKAYIYEAYTQGLITADERSFFDKSLDIDHANKFMTTVQNALKKAGFRVKHSEKGDGKRYRNTKMKSLSDEASWYEGGESEFYDFDKKRGDILLQVTDKGEFDVAGDTAQSEFSLAFTDPNDASRKLVLMFGQAQMEQIIDSAWLAYKNNPSTSRKDGKDFITFEEAIKTAIDRAKNQKYNNMLASEIMTSLATSLRGNLSSNDQEKTRATVVNQVRDELGKIQNSIFNPPKEEKK